MNKIIGTGSRARAVYVVSQHSLLSQFFRHNGQFFSADFQSYWYCTGKSFDFKWQESWLNQKLITFCSEFSFSFTNF